MHETILITFKVWFGQEFGSICGHLGWSKQSDKWFAVMWQPALRFETVPWTKTFLDVDISWNQQWPCKSILLMSARGCVGWWHHWEELTHLSSVTCGATLAPANYQNGTNLFFFSSLIRTQLRHQHEDRDGHSILGSMTPDMNVGGYIAIVVNLALHASICMFSLFSWTCWLDGARAWIMIWVTFPVPGSCIACCQCWLEASGG